VSSPCDRAIAQHLERHPSAIIANSLTRRAQRQERFQIRQPAERQPRDTGDGGTEQQHEARFDGDLDGAPWRWRGAEEHVREIEVLVHPDKEGDEDEPERLQEKRFVHRSGVACHVEAVLLIGRIAGGFSPCYNQPSVQFTLLPKPA